MRRNVTRLGFAAALAAGFALVAGHADRFAVAQPQPKQVDPKKEKEKDTRSPRAAGSPFNFHVVRDAGPRLKAARDYIGFKEVPWNTVCPLVQNILDGPDSFYDPDIDDPRGAVSNRTWGGVQHEAEQILARFPKEGLEFYQNMYGQTAAGLLADGLKNGYDLEALKSLASRYFYTKAGAEGAVLLGTLQLERGDYADAGRYFAKLLTRPGGDDFLTPRVLFRAATALKRSPEKEHGDLYPAVVERLQKATGRDGLTLGRKTYPFDQLKAELDRVIALPQIGPVAGAFATHRGNARRNVVADAGPPFLFPSFPALKLTDVAKVPWEGWVQEQLDYLFAPEDATRAHTVFPLPGCFPVASADVVYHRQYRGVRAVALRDHVVNGKLAPAGEMLWESSTVFGLSTLVAPPSEGPYSDAKKVTDAVKSWWDTYKSKDAAAYLAENPLIGTLSMDARNVYFLDDLALPPPPVGQTVGQPFAPVPVGGVGAAGPTPSDLVPAVKAGQLIAVDRATGRQVWTLGRFPSTRPAEEELVKAGYKAPEPLDEESADRTTDAFRLCLNAVFLGPPLLLDGRLYVPIELADQIRVLCLDPANRVVIPNTRDEVPTLVWQVKLGRAGTTLDANPARRTQGAFLAAGDGVLVCPTNSGASVGIDLVSRRILWGHVYRETVTTPQPKGPQPGVVVGGPFGGVQRQAPNPLPGERWRASAPIIVGNRVIVTGFDGDGVDCLDLRTGRHLWRLRRDANDLYLGGVLGDTLFVVGKDKMRGYKVGGEEPNGGVRLAAWEVAFGAAAPTGHGAIGKDAYHVPVRQIAKEPGKDGTALEVWAVTPAGAVRSKARARAPSDTAVRFGIGNLVFQDGLVIAQSAAELAVYPQLEQKRAEMDKRLAANPDDPEGRLDRGDLLQDEGKLAAAIADYKAAEKHAPADPEKAEPFRRRVRERLYRAYTEQMRKDFPAAEPALAEYAALCESYLEPGESADDEAGHKAKAVERRRLYLSLLAKGRKEQGRLVEAFEHYLALAHLGADRLQPDPDEPAVLRRPDVAARGRIQAMIEEATPAARKGLEARAMTEWEAVKGGNDLARLREFVGLFGPYFPAGAEGELLLAEKLIGGHDEADARAAQLHLLHVRAGTAPPPVRARATEALAGVMVRAGMLDEAVRLYLQLGAEFKDVPVRDGKLGADYLTDLLTDRRLLPYLEPARYPLPTRVRATSDVGAGGLRPVKQQFEVEPVGDFLPEFRRYRFSLEMTQGNGQWLLVGTDRVTEADRYKLGPMQFQYYGFANAGRTVHAAGKVVVAQLGPMVYGFDLGAKTQSPAWTINLLGDRPGASPNNIRTNDPEEMEFVYPDGNKVTVRTKAVVARPGYVCVHTRDGLEAFDPADRTKQLWTRRFLPAAGPLTGDDEFVVLLQTGADKRPTGVQVFRAADGAAVPVPDNGAALRDARAFRVHGRTALLAEGVNDDEPRVLRLLDLVTGKDVWKKEYPAKAVFVRSHDPAFTGAVLPTGVVDILDVASGRPVGAFKLDADRLGDHLGLDDDNKRCRSAQLLADADRFYLVLDRDAGRAIAGGFGGAFGGAVMQLRTTPVNGPLYCFLRATGARAWYADHHFENQSLVLDRFADLPVLIAGQAGGGGRGAGGNTFRGVVVEKERGLLRFETQTGNDGATFQTLFVDRLNRTIELVKFGGAQPLRVLISPDDGR